MTPSPTIISRNDLARNYIGMRQEKTKDDVCWFYFHREGGIAVMNIKELQEQMREWRKLAVQGKLKIMDYNNKTKKTFDGKEWYILVVQRYENGVCVSEAPDPTGMLMNYMVSGFIYAFQKKSNRDDVAKYVMRGLDSGVKLMCCFCNEEIDGYGNNPEPVVEAELKCCDKCNESVVIPARINNLIRVVNKVL